MRRSSADGRLVPTYDPSVGRRRVVLERGMRVGRVPAGDINHVAGGGDGAAVPETIWDRLACKPKSALESEHAPSADAALPTSHRATIGRMGRVAHVMSTGRSSRCTYA
jgi:hypothetical protein